MCNALRVVGDSHVQAFAHMPECVLDHIGPVTMFRIGRDSIPGEGDVITVFGEIDVRCHLLADPRPIVGHNELVLRYMQAIQKYPGDVKAVCGVMPPTDAHVDPDFPRVGLLQDRVSMTINMNASLSWHCAHRGIKFIDMFTAFALDNGTLDPRVSDGTVHVRPEYAKDVLYKQLSGIV